MPIDSTRLGAGISQAMQLVHAVTRPPASVAAEVIAVAPETVQAAAAAVAARRGLREILVQGIDRGLVAHNVDQLRGSVSLVRPVAEAGVVAQRIGDRLLGRMGTAQAARTIQAADHVVPQAVTRIAEIASRLHVRP